MMEEKMVKLSLGFNPLDRVKFVQMETSGSPVDIPKVWFQSPRSGQICSNDGVGVKEWEITF